MNEESLFHQALGLPPADRGAFLAAACGPDAALEGRLRGLVAAHDCPDRLLATPAGDAGRTADFPTAPDAAAGTAEAAGDRVGPYKLLEPLGEGGMGTVWAAEQAEPVRRKVAVKLIKAGMDSRQVLARFEAERQALALMDHPHIARVLDAGATADGRPYFAMELVRGLPVTDYCDRAKLPVRDRLGLFADICRAVQHAHQKGVIHRDLKPSNVLVTVVDGRPVPKVIDFGIAKATGVALTDRTLHTGHFQMVGTPLYMAPEQAELSGVDIDTRADVYSLGVLLYELLTGTTPFDREAFRKAGFDEVRRILREDDPARPSRRVSTLAAEQSSTVAGRRGVDARRLARLVRGELDWLAMRCLEKDRARRYQSPAEVAADVERYLAGEPVLAVPPSARYRAGKFVRRNRAAAAAAGVLAAALALGAVGTAVGLVEARRQAAAAVAAREAADAKRAEAEAVVRFFEDKVLAAGRPKGQGGGLGADVSLGAAVRDSLPALDAAFADQPLVEARLRLTLGTTFLYLGDAARAAEQLAKAGALFTAHRGPDDPRALLSMNTLANSYDALGRHTESLKLNEEVVAAQRRVLPPDHPDALRGMNNLAVSYLHLGRPAEALKLSEETLAIQKRVLPQDHPDTLKVMTNLAVSYAELGRHADALKMNEETLAARKRVLPPDHPDTLKGMHNLANSYRAVGRHADALKLQEETLATQRRVLPPDHPHTLVSMNNLADSYAELGRPADALTLREEALAAQRRVLPPGHLSMSMSMHNLAIDYAVLGRHADALKLREEALAARKRVLPPGDPDILLDTLFVASSLVKLNRGAEALPLLDRCHAEAAGGPASGPEFVSVFAEVRLEHFRRASDPAGCRATAEMVEKLNPRGADACYNAACCRAVAAGFYAKANQPAEAAADADRATAWLAKAVAAGYRDRGHLETDDDLASLRGRPDYRALVAAMRYQAPPPRPAR